MEHPQRRVGCNALLFTHNGSQLISGHWLGLVCVWDVMTGALTFATWDVLINDVGRVHITYLGCVDVVM